MNLAVRFSVLVLALLAWGLAGTASGQFFEDDEACLMCHKYPMIGRTTEEGVFRTYYVVPHLYGQTVHRNVPCRDCHTEIEKLPHDPVKRGVTCETECHSIKNPATGKRFSHKPVYDRYIESTHGRPKLAQGAESDRPYCIVCHSNPLYNPAEPAPPKRIADRCVLCHEDRGFVERWYHHTGRRIHEVKRSSQQIVAMCSTCHADQDMVERQIHAAVMDGRRLGRKFADAVASYEESFHGKLTKRGFEPAADCLDCHARADSYFASVHDIRPSRDPKSPVSATNRLQTCRRCHQDADQGFAALDPHPSYHREDNPLLYYTGRIYSLLGIGVIVGLTGLSLFETHGRRRDGVAWRLRRGSTWRRRGARGRDRLI